MIVLYLQSLIFEPCYYKHCVNLQSIIMLLNIAHDICYVLIATPSSARVRFGFTN